MRIKTVAILHSTIRADEKLIIEAAGKKNITVKLIDIRSQIFDPQTYSADFDVALERSVSTVKGDYAIHFLENLGIPVVNSSAVSKVCGDKFLTSLELNKAKVPTPRFAMVFNIDQAKEAIEKMGGFPVVIKPAAGSWGRLLAKVNDTDSLEAVVEHKDVLGGPNQKAIYIQQYIMKPGRDIRAFVIDGVAICAIYRDSKHWITNTARGGVASKCQITKELSVICKNASNAVGGGILAMDIFETESGFSINEINHTMEFKNSEEPTGVSISGAIVDYCIKQVKSL